MPFELAHTVLGFESTHAAGCRGACSPARFPHPLQFLQAGSHTLEGCFAVGVLGAAFYCRYGDASWAVNQAHARFDFIAMLAAGAAGDEELQVTIMLQRFSVGWIRIHHCLYLLVYYV